MSKRTYSRPLRLISLP